VCRCDVIVFSKEDPKMALVSLQQVPSCSLQSTSVTAALILDCRCELGEGVIYDHRTNSVLWTDILGKRFHRLSLDDLKHTSYDLPKQLGSFALIECEKPHENLPLLCAFDDCFQIYDPIANHVHSSPSKGEDVNPAKGLTRLNDGRVDRSGEYFIAGGFYGDCKGTKMKVFRCHQDSDGGLIHKAIIDNVEVTNSICWSPDGGTMYFADSPTQSIHAFDYKSGQISENRLVFDKVIDSHSVPDGSTVDSEGYIWNAVWRGGHDTGMVRRIDPETGEVVFVVNLPDRTSQVTCCCFGGKDLDILFITTAAESTSAQTEPHAGGLYAIRVPVKGTQESQLSLRL